MTKTKKTYLSGKYDLPDFLKKEKDDIKIYKRWLDRKARNIRRRDGKGHSIAQYKEAIHRAVKKSKGIDAYTNEPLNWHMLGTYINEKAKKGGRRYKKKFAMMPSVDHVNGPQQANYKICAWRTNDAKSDLSYRKFLDLCKKVVKAAS